MLLAAVAQPQPGCPARPDGIQALDGLVPVAQRVCKGVLPGAEAVCCVWHQVRHDDHRRRDGPGAAHARQHEPPQPGAAHEHQHGTDAQNEQCARKMRLQQHQRRHHAQHQCKRQHPHGKALHPVVVERDDVGKHQHHRKFCDLAGLQGAQPRQHQPPLAAVVLRHEQHRRQQEQRNAQKRPRQFVEDVVIHPAGKAHPGDAQRRIEQLRAEIGESIAPPVERHGPRCAAQHHQPKAHQRDHQHQKRQVRRRQSPQPDPVPPAGPGRSSFFHPFTPCPLIVRRRPGR